MTKRTRILAGIGLVIFSVALVWLVLRHHRVFHGKPESEWINGIAYFGDEEQLKQWRSFGLDGLHLLARNLDRGRFYRKAYRRIMPSLPGKLNYYLTPLVPKPADSHKTRMCVVSLLRQLGKDAKPVEPAIARALRDDDVGVRQIALGCYEELLQVMNDKERLSRLPEFLRAMQDADSGIRNNATITLKFYSGQREVVVPVLIKALRDPYVGVRMLAAEAFVRVDTDAAIEAGVVPVLISLLKHPDGQIAWKAAALLGELRKDPALAVPALIEALQSTNSIVAFTAIRSLIKFPSQTDIIVPALSKALQYPDAGVRNAAAKALERLKP